jgi:aminoglycoside phosphotransferase
MKQKKIAALILALAALCLAVYIMPKKATVIPVHENIEDLRVDLKELVSRGDLTLAEAQVALARATAEKKNQRKKKGPKKGGKKNLPNREDREKYLQDAVKSGKITEEQADAKKAWLEKAAKGRQSQGTKQNEKK